MSRQALLLSVLALVLVLVLYYLFAFQPLREDLAQVNEEITAVQDQQRAVETNIARLQQVRAESPAIEASIAAAESVIPTSAGLPAMVRQLQVAADDSGGRLDDVTVSRPARIEEAENPDLAVLEVSVTFTGGYFQQVDFLRRLEEPAISPRALLWHSVAVGAAEYPSLTMDLAGRMYALLPGGDEQPSDAPEEEPTDGVTDAPTDAPTGAPTDGTLEPGDDLAPADETDDAGGPTDDVEVN